MPRYILWLLLLLSTTLWIPAASGQDFVYRPDEQLQIMSVKLGSLELHEGILAYVDGDKTYIPLSEFIESIRIPVEVTAEEAYAEGWFREENNRFVLNYEKRLLSIGGEAQEIDWDLVEWHEFDIYVESQQLKAWLGLEFEVLLNALVILIAENQWLPLEQQLKRHDLWERVARQQPVLQADDSVPLDNPAQIIGWPGFDNNLRFGYRTSDGRSSQQIQYDLLAAADLLWLRSTYSANLNYISNSDLTYSGRLLFEGGATDQEEGGRFRVGDFTAPAVPLVTQQQEGVGFVVSNFAQEQSANFNSIELQGDALNGWDVEVYSNNQLIAFQTVDDSNRYSFTDIPVQTGNNLLRLVFYGPEGQRREQLEEFVIGEQALAPGSTRWSVNAQINNRRLLPGQMEFVLNREEQERVLDELQTAVALQYGISNSLLLNTAISRIPVAEQGSRSFLNVGLNGAVDTLLYSVDLSAVDTGGLASRATAQILGERQNWQAEYAYFKDYESALLQAGIGDERLQHRAQLNWNGRLGESRPVSASARFEHFDSNRDRLRTELRYSQRFSDFNWSSSFSYNLDDDEINRLSGGSLISYRDDDVSINGQLSYALTPQLEARSANISSSWRLNETMNARVNFRKAFDGNQEDNVRLNLSKQLQRWIVSLSSTYNFKRDFNISVNIFTSANRTPTGYALANRSKVATASASARVFLDNNGNKTFDEGDETIPGAKLRISAGKSPERSDDNGHIHLTDLPTNQELSVRLQEGSLEDPYWLPIVPAYKMRLRPGQAYHFEFPLAQSAEIDGTVWLLDEKATEPKPASNVMVELIGEDGEIVKSGRSSYDGFYLLDQIIPGEYTLRISPQQLQRLNLQVDAEIDLSLNGNGDIKTGMDFQLTEINL